LEISDQHQTSFHPIVEHQHHRWKVLEELLERAWSP
jgi:hypothetical protein